MVTITEKIKQLPQIAQPDNAAEAYRAEIPIEYLDADLVPAIPNEILLGSLRDGRLKVRSPIKVRFTTEGKHTIAEAVEINEFGFGENISEAMADLQRTIAELYFTLEKEQGHLGKDLRNVWAIIHKKIHKR